MLWEVILLNTFVIITRQEVKTRPYVRFSWAVPLITARVRVSVASTRLPSCLSPGRLSASGRFLLSGLSLQINNRGKKVK